MKKYILFSSIFIAAVLSAPAQVFELVKEINTAGNSYPSSFTSANNKLFFIATDNVNYNKLWVTEGTAATTQFIGPAGSVIGSISNLVSYNNKLFFSCNDGINGQELWVSDGTIGGTQMFKDVYPGANGSYPQYFTVANNKLFFMGSSPVGERRLYVSDGTAAGTFVVKNNYIDILNGQSTFMVLNNAVYFRSDNGSGAGNGLWKSDGTLAGTVIVKPDLIAGTLGANYAVLNNKLYFSGFDYTNGSELWVTDGTDPGTYMVINLSTDGVGILNSGAPQALTVYNSKIYFSAKDDTHGQELFVTDGTAAGTQLVKDILPGISSSFPSEITVYNGLLYIFSYPLSELWKSDGTDAGTQKVKTILPYARFAAVWNGKIYMVSGSDATIWESDGTATGTKPAVVSNTNNPISYSGADLAFTGYNGAIYFSGFSPFITSGYELCRLVTGLPPVTSFTFTGSGNWSNPANWSGGLVPPANLPSGNHIVITGTCILDVTQNVQSGASITVATGGGLLILGSLNTF